MSHSLRPQMVLESSIIQSKQDAVSLSCLKSVTQHKCHCVHNIRGQRIAAWRVLLNFTPFLLVVELSFLFLFSFCQQSWVPILCNILLVPCLLQATESPPGWPVGYGTPYCYGTPQAHSGNVSLAPQTATLPVHFAFL